MTIFFDFLRPPRLHPKQIPQSFSPAAGSNNWEGATPQSPQLPEKQKSPRTGVPKHGVTGRGGGHVKFLVRSLVTFLFRPPPQNPLPHNLPPAAGKKNWGRPPTPRKQIALNGGGSPFLWGRGVKIFGKKTWCPNHWRVH